ncbi:MAG: hypothetical protein GY953_49975 [bacterium]|nr:hypothetical protein [bacterium]
MEHFSIDPTPFFSLLDLRDGKVKAKELDAASLYATYLSQIGQVVELVDRLEK